MITIMVLTIMKIILNYKIMTIKNNWIMNFMTIMNNDSNINSNKVITKMMLIMIIWNNDN